MIDAFTSPLPPPPPKKKEKEDVTFVVFILASIQLHVVASSIVCSISHSTRKKSEWAVKLFNEWKTCHE